MENIVKPLVGVNMSRAFKKRWKKTNIPEQESHLIKHYILSEICGFDQILLLIHTYNWEGARGARFQRSPHSS